jgi:hypothetical protein
MKLTAGAHPDLPFPFSNGPEPPPEPLGGLAEPLRLATIRHENGVRHLSSLLNYWLTRSGLSYEQLLLIADWGLNERGMLDKGTLSRIKSGSRTRGASWRHLDAMAAANQAIWLWQVKGSEYAHRKLGPHTGWGVQDKWLDSAAWLPHPDHPNEPLEFADMAEVLAGYLDLPYLGAAPMTATDARLASGALAQLLDRICGERNWGPMVGARNLMQAYPVGDRGRQQRMRRVIAGEHVLSADELEGELHALAEMIRIIRRLKPGLYGPRELRDELMSGSPPGHE